jgi:hypothetical protein
MENIKGIFNISGMGDDYEESCQIMLQAGFEWLENNKTKTEKLKTETWELLCRLRSGEAKELYNEITQSVEDCTGAMAQAVLGHLWYISVNGIEKWKSEAKKRR